MAYQIVYKIVNKAGAVTFVGCKDSDTQATTKLTLNQFRYHCESGNVLNATIIDGKVFSSVLNNVPTYEEKATEIGTENIKTKQYDIYFNQSACNLAERYFARTGIQPDQCTVSSSFRGNTRCSIIGFEKSGRTTVLYATFLSWYYFYRKQFISDPKVALIKVKKSMLYSELYDVVANLLPDVDSVFIDDITKCTGSTEADDIRRFQSIQGLRHLVVTGLPHEYLSSSEHWYVKSLGFVPYTEYLALIKKHNIENPASFYLNNGFMFLDHEKINTKAFFKKAILDLSRMMIDDACVRKVKNSVLLIQNVQILGICSVLAMAVASQYRLAWNNYELNIDSLLVRLTNGVGMTREHMALYREHRELVNANAYRALNFLIVKTGNLSSANEECFFIRNPAIAYYVAQSLAELNKGLDTESFVMRNLLYIALSAHLPTYQSFRIFYKTKTNFVDAIAYNVRLLHSPASGYTTYAVSINHKINCNPRVPGSPPVHYAISSYEDLYKLLSNIPTR